MTTPPAAPPSAAPSSIATTLSSAAITTLDAAMPVREVVVLEDRARVVRRGLVNLPAGQARVRIAGVAPVLVDKSITARVAADSGVTVADTHAKREVAPWFDGATDPRVAAAALAELTARRDAARAAARSAADDAAAAESAAAALDELCAIAARDLADDAAWGRTAPGAGDRLAELGTRAGAAAARAATLAVDAARAHAELARLERLVAARERDLGREIASITLDVLAARAGEVELSVEYVVPCACWRPYHTATLRADDVEVSTDACVWQSTGEDWREVRLRFSTERPSLGTSPPDLHDDLLRIQPKSALVITARDQEIHTTGEGAARREAVELPGVDDGGITRILAAPLAASIPSDGRPYRVRLSSFTAPAERSYIAYPERAPAAILRTRQENTSPAPLLAGPVDLIRDGGLTGRTSLLFIAPGERFLLGWGADPAVRIHRTARTRHEDAGLLNSWSTTTHRIAIRLSNLSSTPRTLSVTERIPISEVEQAEVILSRPDAWRLEDDDNTRRDPTPLITDRTQSPDGLLTWSVTLPPHSRRAIPLEYLVKSKT